MWAQLHSDIARFIFSFVLANKKLLNLKGKLCMRVDLREEYFLYSLK